MNVFALITGMFLITVGIAAVASSDFSSGWEWLIAGAALTFGIGGLATTLWRADAGTD